MKNERIVLRIKELMQRFHLTQTEMAAKLGIGQSNLSGTLSGKRPCGDGIINKVIISFPEINTEWLLYGEGDMLKTGHVTQNNINGNNNYNNGGTMTIGCPTCGKGANDALEVAVEEVRKPIIPTEWTYQPDVDIFEEVRNNIHKVAKSRFVALGIPIDIWHIVRDDSLAPRAYAGDYLGLSMYPQGSEDPVWGKYHAVDTRTNGIIIRMLFPDVAGYRMEAPNRERYPDMIIPRDNVISVSRVVCVVRIAL